MQQIPPCRPFPGKLDVYLCFLGLCLYILNFIIFLSKYYSLMTLLWYLIYFVLTSQFRLNLNLGKEISHFCERDLAD